MFSALPKYVINFSLQVDPEEIQKFGVEISGKSCGSHSCTLAYQASFSPAKLKKLTIIYCILCRPESFGWISVSHFISRVSQLETVAMWSKLQFLQISNSLSIRQSNMLIL